LIETGCVDLDDPTQPAAGLVPYGVNAPLWSDGAVKNRWMALPDGEHITVEDDGQLAFPTGSVLVKQFAKAGVMLETRLLVRHDDGGWAGYSYVWDETGSFASYERGGAVVDVDGADWLVPSSAQCMQCHTAVVGQTLGPELGQLDGDFRYPTGRVRNQLDTLSHIGMFSAHPGVGTAYPSLDDETATVQDKAKAVLHANCAGCHQPGGSGGSALDFRYSTPASLMGACNVLPTADTLGVTGANLITAGDAERSMIAVRMGTRSLGQMPPLGTALVDEDGLAVVREWIDGMEACP